MHNNVNLKKYNSPAVASITGAGGGTILLFFINNIIPPRYEQIKQFLTLFVPILTGIFSFLYFWGFNKVTENLKKKELAEIAQQFRDNIQIRLDDATTSPEKREKLISALDQLDSQLISFELERIERITKM